MGSLGPTEIILIILVIVLLFGAKKLPELARGSGRALRIFKAETKGLVNDDEDTTRATNQTTSRRPTRTAARCRPAPPRRPPTVTPADDPPVTPVTPPVVPRPSPAASRCRTAPHATRSDPAGPWPSLFAARRGAVLTP